MRAYEVDVYTCTGCTHGIKEKIESFAWTRMYGMDTCTGRTHVQDGSMCSMEACTHVHMYYYHDNMHTHDKTFTHEHVHMYTCTHDNMHTHDKTCTHDNMHTCTHVHMYTVHLYSCTHVLDVHMYWMCSDDVRARCP